MKTLLIMRHAKSSREDASLDDYDRPLNKRGRRDAPRMGKLLVAEKALPDLIVSSTARRARETVETLLETVGYRGRILYCPELYLAPPEEYLAVLATLSDKQRRPLLVGHNPGLEELVAALTGRREPLPTAAIAQVKLGIDRWRGIKSAPRGRLARIWRPRELE